MQILPRHYSIHQILLSHRPFKHLASDGLSAAVGQTKFFSFDMKDWKNALWHFELILLFLSPGNSK